MRPAGSRPVADPGSASGVEVVEVRDGTVAERRRDELAREEPLEIRLADETVAIVMRTPGADERLALGFLVGEGILSSADDLSAISHCGRPGTEGFGNTVNAVPAPGARIAWDRLDRGARTTVASSACGVCGRLTIEDLLAGLEPVVAEPVPSSVVFAAVEALRERQPLFDRTGGCHAVSACAADGTPLATHEDVGRHNAVDKVVGSLLLARRAGDARVPAILVVSGRPGFEIVQKAARARIPIVAGVSAPTSLAAELAERAGITLCGFVRRGRMNVYAHPERIAGAGG
jgi:FdhD protein